MMHCKIETGRQTLRLDGLQFSTPIGILPKEVGHPQPIQVSAELNLGLQPLAPKGDDIASVLDYRLVKDAIIETCTQNHVNLLESLIGKVAYALLELPGVEGVRVKITKLEIFDDCEVSIETEAGQW